MFEIECLGDFRLCGTEERGKLREIDAILAVIVVSGTGDPSATAIPNTEVADDRFLQRSLNLYPGHRGDNKALKAFFAGVAFHT